MSLKIEEIKILEQEPMCKHTTFRIGGAAKYFAMPKNTAEIQTLIAYCKEHKLDYVCLEMEVMSCLQTPDMMA